MAGTCWKMAVVGASALLIGGSFAIGSFQAGVESAEGACSYLDFSRKPGGEWRPVGCDALEDLLDEQPDLSYLDEDGEIHSPVLLAQEVTPTPTPAPTATPEACQNPYDDGLGVGEEISRVACWYGLSPEFLSGLFQVESRLQHYAPDGSVKRSYAGAIGIGQVMPGNGGESTIDSHRLDIWREADNMELGAQALGRKCDAAASIAGANGFETRPASGEEPCGAIHYVCVGTWGDAWSAYGSTEGALVDEWYDSPEEIMARAYNGVSCGGDLVGLLGWARGRAASYWTMHYVEHVLSEAGISTHSFDDEP